MIACTLLPLDLVGNLDRDWILVVVLDACMMMMVRALNDGIACCVRGNQQPRHPPRREKMIEIDGSDRRRSQRLTHNIATIDGMQRNPALDFHNMPF